MPDSYTITMKQNVRFQGAMYPVKLNSTKFKMADLQLFLTSLYVISGYLDHYL